MSKALVKIPQLKCGNDSKIAAALDKLLPEAEEGVVRILRAGFLLEFVASNLDHGEIEPWIEANCKKRISRASFFAWRALAKNVMEVVGIKSLASDFSVPVHEMLALPACDVPPDMKPLRKKIDELMEGKSYRQLTLHFKSTKPEGGFRPNAGAVQEWLKEKHPELAGTKFDELPAEVQRAFKKFWGNRKVTPGEKEAALWDKGINMLESVGECHDEKWFANPQGDAPLKHIERAALLFQDCANDLKAFLAKASKKKN